MLMKVSIGWIRRCEEKLMQAAIDLAIFTQNGVHAKEISELALICEELEKRNFAKEKPENFHRKHEKLRKGIRKICSIGREAWTHRPEKYQHYIWQT
jgi:hypothetical protein